MEVEKSLESISGKASDLEAEENCSATCSLDKRDDSAFDKTLTQDYQEYLNLHHQITCLYLIPHLFNSTTTLIIYDSESKKKEERILNTPEPLNSYTCITQLPNGSLFCFGKADPISGITLIIERNDKIIILPSGAPRYLSSVGQAWTTSLSTFLIANLLRNVL